MESSALAFAEKLDSAASGAKALSKERLYRSAGSAAPPKSDFFSKLGSRALSKRDAILSFSANCLPD
jgi:hypothetical protein